MVSSNVVLHLTGYRSKLYVQLLDDDYIPGQIEDDHYNGPHGLKEGIEKSFDMVLQCIFETTSMNIDFFK